MDVRELPMVAARKLLTEWDKAGIIPPNTARVIIEVDVDRPLRVLIESYGDDRHAQAALQAVMELAEETEETRDGNAAEEQETETDQRKP